MQTIMPTRKFERFDVGAESVECEITGMPSARLNNIGIGGAAVTIPALMKIGCCCDLEIRVEKSKAYTVPGYVVWIRSHHPENLLMDSMQRSYLIGIRFDEEFFDVSKELVFTILKSA